MALVDAQLDAFLRHVPLDPETREFVDGARARATTLDGAMRVPPPLLLGALRAARVVAQRDTHSMHSYVVECKTRAGATVRRQERAIVVRHVIASVQAASERSGGRRWRGLGVPGTAACKVLAHAFFAEERARRDATKLAK